MASYTYKAVGNREDLIDIVTNIAPDENFLQAKFGRTTVKAMQHDWLCDGLRPAAANRKKEDEDFATAEAVARVRLSNYIQHFMVGYRATDAQNMVAKAGIDNELSYQIVKATKELSRDFEMAILKNNSAVAGVAGTGGQMGGVRYFIGGDAIPVAHTAGTFTFADHKLQTGQAVMIYITSGGTVPTGVEAGKPYYARVLSASTFTIHPTAQDAQADANKVTPTGNGTNAYITRSNIISLNGVLTEDSFNDMMEICWRQGASIGSAIMSGKRKREVSQWTAGVMKTTDMEVSKRKTVVDVWETDFGLLNLEAHRQQTDDRIDFFEYSNWRLAFLQPFKVEDVPRKGTYSEKVIHGMATIECRSPISNGAIIGIV